MLLSGFHKKPDLAQARRRVRPRLRGAYRERLVEVTIHDGGQVLILLRQPQQRCHLKSGRCLGLNPQLCGLLAKLSGGAFSERRPLRHRFRSIARRILYPRVGKSSKSLCQPTQPVVGDRISRARGHL